MQCSVIAHTTAAKTSCSVLHILRSVAENEPAVGCTLVDEASFKIHGTCLVIF